MWRITSILILSSLFGIVVLQVLATPPVVPAHVASSAMAHPGGGDDHEHAADALIGVRTCAASGCHGGPDEGHKSLQSRASTIWYNRDPHARAYGVLESDRSKRIVAVLKSDDVEYDDYLRQRCTTCHSTAQEEILLDEPKRDLTFRDGVGCESCHGPAKDWLDSHQLTAWKEGKEGWADEKKQSLGFRETGDLETRVNACVKCHVGGANSSVDHDLIAAGHPRLNFEYHYYMDRLSRLAAHWAPEKLMDTPAQSWVTGQRIAARQSLELLHERSSHGAWPEFSEYGCYFCHHDLDVGGRERTENLGQPAWGSWYFSRFVFPDGSPRQLRDAMKMTGSDRDTVAALTETIQPIFAGSDAKQMLIEVVTNAPTRGNWEQGVNWDEIAQWYLAIWALRDELQQGGADVKALDGHLGSLAKILRAPFEVVPREFEGFEDVQTQLLAELTKLMN